LQCVGLQATKCSLFKMDFFIPISFGKKKNQWSSSLG
jgi:hypothetical protein